MFDQQFRPNQFKPSFFISECGRIHRYAVVQVQHGHKIKSLGAILNFNLKTPATWEKVPVPKSPGNENSSLTLALMFTAWSELSIHSDSAENPWILQEKLPCLAFWILINFCKVLRSCAFIMHGCVFDWHKTCFSLVTWQPANPLWMLSISERYFYNLAIFLFSEIVIFMINW